MININRLDNYGDRIFSAYQYDFVRNKNPFYCKQNSGNYWQTL